MIIFLFDWVNCFVFFFALFYLFCLNTVVKKGKAMQTSLVTLQMTAIATVSGVVLDV